MQICPTLDWDDLVRVGPALSKGGRKGGGGGVVGLDTTS